jgi:lambda family phage portal protein
MNVYENMGSMKKSKEYRELVNKKEPKLELVENTTKVKAFQGNTGRYYSDGYGGDGSKWYRGLSSSGKSPILNHWKLRHNARSAYHENSQARSIVDRFTDTVVDVGLILDAAPATGILGIEKEAAEKWSKDVSARFNMWAKSKQSVRDETMNLLQAQRLVETYTHRDNDWFARLHYSPRKDLVNPLQVQIIDPDMIIGTGYTSTYGHQDTMYAGRYPVDGIYRDNAGREIAYLVTGRDDTGKVKQLKIPAWGPKSKRRFFLHGFQPEYAGQGRGYSRLSHALQDFENLTDYASAEIKKAIAQSGLAMYNKPGKDKDASDPYEGLTNRTAGPPTDEEQAAIDSGDPDGFVDYHTIPEATFDTPGSVGVFNLKGGEELKAFANTAPADGYSRFVDSFTSYLSASMGIPIEVLLMKFGQNYSASRGALVLFWRVAEIWRDELIADFLNPVYEAWLSEEIAAGRISAPGWSDPVMRNAWLKTQWWGAPMPNIDPLREAKASKEYVEMGATDVDRVSRNLNGSDGELNRQKLKRQIPELTPVPWSKTGNKKEDSGQDSSGNKTKRGPGRPIGS